MKTKTYFIRHSAEWNVSNEFREQLLNEGRIAIKFDDIRSRNPADYSPKAQGAIRRFCDLADNGGYVCATMFPTYTGCIVGKVRAGTKITFQKVPAPDNPEQIGIAKLIQLERAKKIPPPLANRLLIGQPQQGTIAEWKIIGDRVSQIFQHGRLKIRTVSDLLPYEQEIMCSEFLRTAQVKEFRLPQLVHLSALVGHNRRAIDIDGVTGRGATILAQVTYAEDDSSIVSEKLTSLKEADQTKSTHFILFCRASEPRSENGVRIFPIEHVFEIMKKRAAWRAAIGFV